MAGSSEGGVRTTPTAIIRNGLPRPPSTMPRPHRVRPGSTPMTRMLTAPHLSRTPVRTEHTVCGPHLCQRRAASGILCAGWRATLACSVLVVELGEDLVAHVAVGPHVLDVVAVLEGLDDPKHLACAIDVELDLQRGDEGGLSRVVVDARTLQGGADGHEVGRLAHDLEGFTDVVDLFCTRVQDD